MGLITKIRLKLLWLSLAWPFYWAHKPLCQHFAEDIIRLGRLHLCRSCLFAWLGILTFPALLFLNAQLIIDLSLHALIAISIFVIPLSFPHLYKKLPRFVRDILRLFMGFLFPFAIYITLAVNIWLGALSLAALFLFWLFYLKLRKKRKLQACDHCDELKAGSICSGFTMQAECSRAYEKQATRIVMNSGYIPGK